MAEGIEYLTFSRFYFEVEGKDKLLISKVSGISITIETTDATAPIGATKDIKTATQATPTGTSTENITLEFVSTGDNNTLIEWYLKCHPKPRDGGARKQMDERYTASLVFYKQDGGEGARWNITDAIPAKYSTSPVSAEGNELFIEKIEIAHAGLVRANI